MFRIETEKFARTDMWDLAITAYWLHTGNHLITYDKDTTYYKVYTCLIKPGLLPHNLDGPVRQLVIKLLWGDVIGCFDDVRVEINKLTHWLRSWNVFM